MIYICEDDLNMAQDLCGILIKYGYSAVYAQDFSNVAQDIVARAPELVLLDITLPFYSGYYWCSEIRKTSRVPIIFLSSAADNMNIVMAMNMGGDDFIAKPFDMSVLMAKIQALLRRTYDFAQPSPLLAHRGAVLDAGSGALKYEGKTIDLTRNEFRILLALMEKRGNVVSREKLMERLWETDSFVDENTLTVNVNRLRKKLDAAGLNGFIATRFGVGYIIE